MRWPVRFCGSGSVQKGWPANVVGTTVPARTTAANRGKMPRTKAVPATNIATALARTASSGSGWAKTVRMVAATSCAADLGTSASALRRKWTRR